MEVHYSHRGPAGSPALEVFLSAGKDRHWQPRLLAGHSGKVRLTPGAGVTRADERRLHLRFIPHGLDAAQAMHWSGPDLPVDASYRIVVDIHADGRVESRHCIKPCRLEG